MDPTNDSPLLSSEALNQLKKSLESALAETGLLATAVHLNIILIRFKNTGIGQYVSYMRPSPEAQEIPGYTQALQIEAGVSIMVTAKSGEELHQNVAKVHEFLFNKRVELRQKGVLSLQAEFNNLSVESVSSLKKEVIFKVLYEICHHPLPSEGIIRRVVVNYSHFNSEL